MFLKHKNKIGFVILLMILLLSRGVSHQKVLVIEDVEQSKKSVFILPHQRFTLGYIHSVLLTPAEEFFKVQEDNTLMLEKTIYESFGVGLPYSQEKWDFEIKDGKFILYIQRPFKEISMRISPIPKHWISIEDKKYPLLQMVNRPENAIKIYAKEEWILKVLDRVMVL